MKLSAIIRTWSLLLLILAGSTAFGFNQDHYFFYKSVGGHNYPNGVAVGLDDKIYVADYSNYRVVIYNPDLGFLTEIKDGYAPHDVAVSKSGTVFVADPNNFKVHTYDPTGGSASVFMTGSNGYRPHFVRFHPVDGNLYIKDSGGTTMVYKPDGTFVKSFYLGDGTPYSVMPDGRLHLFNGEIYNDNGIREMGGPGGRVRYANGLCYTANEYRGSWFNIYDADFRSLYQYAGPWWYLPYFTHIFEINHKGDFIGTDGGGTVYMLRRCEGSSMGPETRNAPPIAHVTKVAQRPGTTLLDIEYQVNDMDDATVQTAAAAFTKYTSNPGDTNNNMDLNNMILLNSLMEGTETNVGAAIVTGSTYKLTWDVGADWNQDFGDLSVHIFARDSRPLLMGLHFLDLPGEGPVPAVKITRSPVHQSWFMEPLMWLAASKNPAVEFISESGVGSIKGKGTIFGGIYDGVVLATSMNVTQKGREFVEALMGVHEATPTQVQAAREAATPGNVNAWDLNGTFQKIDVDRPRKINEYGFDTGDYNSEWFWLIKE